MRHLPIKPNLFIENRRRLARLLAPNSLAVVNANDVLPTNADGTLPLQPNTDLFYLSGVEQEESILLIYPEAFEPKNREILFLRETTEHLQTWEGHKLTKEQATQVSGIKNVKWLSDWPGAFHSLMCDVERVYLNANEHKRAAVELRTREDRFVADCRQRYPLHNYQSFAPLLHKLRAIKSPAEVDLLRQAIQVTHTGFERVAQFVKPGVAEFEIEAELTHEFMRRRARHAYAPIIASGKNACVLHYIDNDQVCKAGELLLLDVGASYANYNADMTRTIPVSGKFTRRQKHVYEAVLRGLRASIKSAVVGKLHRDWQKEAQAMMNDELLALGLLKRSDIRKQTEDEPASREYFMHGLGHPLGLDVHDVASTNQPFAPGWVLTVEPGIYIPDEGLAVRLENNILITEAGPVDLMAQIPLEPEEIERLMK